MILPVPRVNDRHHRPTEERGSFLCRWSTSFSSSPLTSLSDFASTSPSSFVELGWTVGKRYFDQVHLRPSRYLDKSESPLSLLKVSILDNWPRMSANTHSLPPLLVPQHPSHSEFDPPTETSVFSSPLLLALLIILVFSGLRTIFANRFGEILHEDRHSEALTALMAIFTPTKSSWPSDVLEATRQASVYRLGRGSSSSLGPSGSGSGFGKGEIRLRFSAVYEHILNGDLELQPTASVDLVKAMLLERDGIEVDGWKIKVVVEWTWMWRVSLWVIKALGSRLVNLSELWDSNTQEVISVHGTGRILFFSDDPAPRRLHTCWV